MRLAFICKYCTEESQLNFVVSDRFKFLIRHGENYSCRCAKCGALNEIHVNRIYARTNKPLLIVSLFFTFGIAAVLESNFYFADRVYERGIKGAALFFFLLIIPFLIWSVLYAAESGKIRRFNDHRV